MAKSDFHLTLVDLQANPPQNEQEKTNIESIYVAHAHTSQCSTMYLMKCSAKRNKNHSAFSRQTTAMSSRCVAIAPVATWSCPYIHCVCRPCVYVLHYVSVAHVNRAAHKRFVAIKCWNRHFHTSECANIFNMRAKMLPHWPNGLYETFKYRLVWNWHIKICCLIWNYWTLFRRYRIRKIVNVDQTQPPKINARSKYRRKRKQNSAVRRIINPVPTSDS